MEMLQAKYDPFRPDERLEKLVTETEKETVSSWGDFQQWLAPFNVGGCFRGHRDASWSLVTTLDRALWKTISIEKDGICNTSATKVNPARNERAALLEFQRGAHHYYASTPASDQIVDWLALMQHFGAPTRLLDWTRSPYVALYFAMQGDSAGDSALWAIDLQWFEERANELLRQHDKGCPDRSDFKTLYEYTNRILLGDDNPGYIVAASPIRLNERMMAQQGQFLCSLRHRGVFSASLLEMLIGPPTVDRQVVSKVVLKRDQRVQFLEELRRMNIHSASLFPGLDGFARSIAVNLDIDVAHQMEDRKQELIEELGQSQDRHRRK